MAWTVDGLSYDKRKKITVQTANVDSDQSDFPLLVKINADTDMSDANADGFDIRFTEDDGSTLLKYERQEWTGGGGSAVTAIFWLKSNIGSSTATEVYIYWRSTDTADGEDATNVWDANFKGVYHMTEASGNIEDSSGSGNSLTVNGTPNYHATGKIGYGIEFDGSTDYFNKTSAAVTAAPITFECWMEPDVETGYMCLVTTTEPSGSTGDHLALFTLGGIANDPVGVQAYDGTTAARAEKTDYDLSWQYVAGTLNTATSRYAFLDGVKGAQNTTNVAPSSITRTAIGAMDRGASVASYYDGIMDEVRISDSVRADSWLKFVYYNINEADNELTWSAVETMDGVGPILNTTSKFW